MLQTEQQKISILKEAIKGRKLVSFDDWRGEHRVYIRSCGIGLNEGEFYLSWRDNHTSNLEDIYNLKIIPDSESLILDIGGHLIDRENRKTYVVTKFMEIVDIVSGDIFITSTYNQKVGKEEDKIRLGIKESNLVAGFEIYPKDWDFKPCF